MNYTTLTEQIKSYANRKDAAFNAQIPNFIEQGINRIYSEAKNIGFEIITNVNLKVLNWQHEKVHTMANYYFLHKCYISCSALCLTFSANVLNV